MKYLLFSLALLLSSASFGASSLVVVGGVGADSNFVYRGESLTQNKPSVNGNVGIAASFDGLSVFGNAAVHTLSGNGLANVKGLGIGELGVGLDNSLFTAQAGVRQYWNLNRNSIAADQSLAREAFVRGTVGMFGGDVMGEYDRAITVNTDSYFKVGYEHSIFFKGLKVGAAVAGKDYNGGVGVKYNNSELFANYAATNNLSFYAQDSFGGHDATNVKIPNVISGGLKFNF